jgi:hypothetical protein
MNRASYYEEAPAEPTPTATPPTDRWRYWIALAALVVLFALGFFYIGSTHRDRCLKAGNDGCTILPWSGTPDYSTAGWGGWGGGSR